MEPDTYTDNDDLVHLISDGVVSHNCFARPTHVYLGMDAGRDFEREIVVKVNVPEVLRREVYAVPALLGASAVVVAERLDALTSLVVWGAVVGVIAVRVSAIVLDLHVPTPQRAGARP